MGFTGGVKDNSRAGAYHNARFRDLGAELGLSIERYPAIGWSLTTVPDATAAAYAAQVEQLRAAIVHVPEPWPPPAADRPWCSDSRRTRRPTLARADRAGAAWPAAATDIGRRRAASRNRRRVAAAAVRPQ